MTVPPIGGVRAAEIHANPNPSLQARSLFRCRPSPQAKPPKVQPSQDQNMQATRQLFET
jgi:hypothetical protein